MNPTVRIVVAFVLSALLAACGGGADRHATADASDQRATALAVHTRDAAATVRFVRLEATSEVNGNPWTSVAEINVLDATGAAIPRTGWAVSADSQEVNGEHAPATNAIDGDPNSFWHTQWQGGAPLPPHALTIDFGQAHAVAGFRYLPRQLGVNGRIAGWRFYTSPDGDTWTLAAQGAFTDGTTEITVMFAATAPVDSPPVLTAVANRSDTVGIALAQQMAATDADGDTLAWSATGLPAGLGIDTSTGLISGTPTVAGAFGVTVQVSDGHEGGVSSTTFAWTIVPGGNSAVSAQYVRLEALSEVNGNPWTSVAEFNVLDAAGATLSRKGWTASADSEELVGEYAPALRAIDGDPNSFWHTQWQNGAPGMPHALTVNLGVRRSVGGFRMLPRQGGINGRIADYRFWTSTDGAAWTLAAHGTFADSEDEKTVLLTGAAAPPANQPPTLAAVAAQGGTVGQSASLALVGNDPDGDALTYSATGLPNGLAIDAASGAISGTPTTAGSFSVTAKASDGRGGTASVGFGWTIAAAAVPPSGAVQYVRLEALSEVNGNPWTSMAEFNVLDANGGTIPRGGWTVVADSEELVGEYAPATRAIDGDSNSFWHTVWDPAAVPMPHSLTVNLGAPLQVSGFKYLPRQNFVNGRIANWRFWTSPNGSTWTLASSGTFVDSASEQGWTGATTGPTPPAPPATPNATRAARIAAFASGPLVAGIPWHAGESVTSDTVRRLSSGQHIVYTSAGTAGTAEPTLGGTILDGRPIPDGSATAYVNGRVLAATQAGAPVVTAFPNVGAAGLALTSFAAGDFQPARYAVTQGCKSISTGTSFIGHYCFANGTAAGSGNATSYASGPYGAGLSSAYSYHSNSWEEEFIVTDSRFGLVFANSGSPIDVEVDGVQVQAGPTASSGVEGWTLQLDYQGVVKRRTVRVISAAGSIGTTLRGVALTSTGKVEAGTLSNDQVLVLGDSINASVTPISEAGAQMMSYWVQRDLGFGGAINMAVGGSGYLSQNTNTFNVQNLLANAANQALIAGYAPNITHVIIGAGFNDRGNPVPAVQAAALATWKAVRALLPNARISVTDGWSGSSGPDANALALAAGLSTTFAQWGDANSRLIHSIGTSAATAYVNGTGNAGTPITTGNSSIYTSVDSVHPTPAGARYLARRLSDDINAAWGGNY